MTVLVLLAGEFDPAEAWSLGHVGSGYLAAEFLLDAVEGGRINHAAEGVLVIYNDIGDFDALSEA